MIAFLGFRSNSAKLLVRFRIVAYFEAGFCRNMAYLAQNGALEESYNIPKKRSLAHFSPKSNAASTTAFFFKFTYCTGVGKLLTGRHSK